MWFTQKETQLLKIYKGDLLVVEGGDIASCAIATEECEGLCFQNSILRVSACKFSNLSFLQHVLHTAKSYGHIDLICNKAAIPHFTKEKFQAIQIPCPPLPEQKRIADFLDRKCGLIDRVLEKTKASIEEYKKLKQSVITEAVTRGIRGDRPMKDSGIEWIGEIPKTWNTSKVGHFYNFYSGETLTNEEISDSGEFLVYGANGIRGFYSKFNLSDKHILIGRVGALCGNIHLTNDKIWVTEHALISHRKLNTLDEFYGYVFQAMNLLQYSKASAQPVISNSTISSLKTVFPPLPEQQEIAEYLDKKCAVIDSLIAKKERFIEEMESYRKSLIFEYVTGKKEARQA